MSKLGGAWLNSREEEDGTKTYYYSISIDEALMPFVIDKNKKIVMKQNKNKGDNKKAPDMIVEAYIPKPKEKKEKPIDPNFEENIIAEDEVPFM